jgi:hypothetical protein
MKIHTPYTLPEHFVTKVLDKDTCGTITLSCGHKVYALDSQTNPHSWCCVVCYRLRINSNFSNSEDHRQTELSIDEKYNSVDNLLEEYLGEVS